MALWCNGNTSSVDSAMVLVFEEAPCSNRGEAIDMVVCAFFFFWGGG
jgi:hypothetical protein